MSVTTWSDERVAYLRAYYPTRTRGATILAALNAMPGPTITYGAMGGKAAYLNILRPPGLMGRPPQDDSMFAASCRWEDACDAAGLRFDDIPDPDAVPPPRRGIMSGKPPNHAEMVAARVAMASQARMAVADVGVRGLV